MVVVIVGLNDCSYIFIASDSRSSILFNAAPWASEKSISAAKVHCFLSSAISFDMVAWVKLTIPAISIWLLPFK